MVHVVRTAWWLLVVGVAGCQCVTVPERDYACEPNDQACLAADAGAADAGVADAGAADAGPPDAAVPCDGGACLFGDAGICQSWACVDALWTVSPETTTHSFSTTELPAGVDGGEYGWFGGVLLPDGRVLAVAHTADRFLTFDPVSLVVETFGPPLLGSERKYAGGVLGPNGKVYVFPYAAHTLLELTPEDGGVREVGPTLSSSDGGGPLYVGGVVDAFGTLWSASEHPDGLPLLRFDPLTNQTAFYLGAGGAGAGKWGGWWGMARLPDDRLLAFPKEYFANPDVLSPFMVVISPSEELDDAGTRQLREFDLRDGGFPLQGGSLTRDGQVCATPAGLESRVVCVKLAPAGGLQTATFSGPPGLTGYGFNSSFGDGRVWTTPDLNDQAARIASDGGITTLFVQAGRYGYLGQVATPQGLVAIPGAPGLPFLLIQPRAMLVDEVESRPMPVLLSPWFNKL